MSEFIPANVKASLLYKALVKKNKQSHLGRINYLNEFERLANLVASEARFIVQVFPEYTPHDQDNHLGPLFQLADQILGQECYDELNSTELFLLSSSLYAHDWGMAVSHEEKDAIRMGDRDLLAKFAHIEEDIDATTGLGPDNEEWGIPSSWSEARWQDYLRRTHAKRSAARIRQHFIKLGGGLGEALAQICLGHAATFRQLESEEDYPISRGVANQGVKIRALALYLSLVDRFDISDARTPYAIWRFVAPRDETSALEWRKHRGIHAVFSETSSTGRKLMVHGQTNDEEVFHAFEDLHRECADQFDKTIAMLQSLQPHGGHLDLNALEWQIIAKGFDPISIRFEFERDRMFQILADEIYESDPYVFIRELVQNALDAHEARRHLSKKSDLSCSYEDLITINVQHQNNGDAIIAFNDNGIGMNSRIIRDYLAQVGTSFYKSEAFTHLGVKMDAISRYGVGLLSCFMVADRVEINTRHCPEIDPLSKPLYLNIIDFRKSFRTRYTSQRKAGTSVIVHVKGEKLQFAPTHHGKRLRVADYVSVVAAFTHTPILVQENDCSYLICPPDARKRKWSGRFTRVMKKLGTKSTLRSLPEQVIWEDIFEDHSVHVAERYLTTRRLDVESDLGLIGWRGYVELAVPKDSGWLWNNFAIRKGQYARSIYQTRSVDAIGEEADYSGVHERSWQHEHAVPTTSSRRTSLGGVFVRGILVPGLELTEHLLRGLLDWPLPPLRAFICLPENSNLQPVVSRMNIRGKNHAFGAVFRSKLVEFVAKNIVPLLVSLQPRERYFQLGAVICTFRLKAHEMADIFPVEKWPVITFSNKGIDFRDQIVGNLETLEGMPTELIHAVQKDVENMTIEEKWKPTLAIPWAGSPCFLLSGYQFGDRGTFEYVRNAFGEVITRFYKVRSLRFLNSGSPDRSPLEQLIYKLSHNSFSEAEIEDISMAAVADPASISVEQWQILWKSKCKKLRTGDSLTLVPFEEPFEQCLLASVGMANILHPVIKLWIRCYLAFEMQVKFQHISKAKIKSYQEVFNSLGGALADRASFAFQILIASVETCWCTARALNLLPHQQEWPQITSESLVPLATKNYAELMIDSIKYKSGHKNIVSKDFGRQLHN